MVRLIIWCKPYAKYFLAAWVVALLSVSSIPSIPTLKIHTAKSEIRLDYLIHFCEYGILAGMAFLAFVNNEFKMSNRKFTLIAASLILFAILDEYHQKLIPGRAFNLKDIYSNIAGIIAALVYCYVVFRNIKNRNSRNIS